MAGELPPIAQQQPVAPAPVTVPHGLPDPALLTVPLVDPAVAAQLPTLIGAKSDVDRAIYQGTYLYIVDALAQITRTLEDQRHLALTMVVTGGSAVAIYLPPLYGKAYIAGSYIWDTRIVTINQQEARSEAYVAAVNVIRRESFMLATARLNQQLQQVQGLTPFAGGNYFELVERPIYGNEVLGALLTIDCQIGNVRHSILENVFFQPLNTYFAGWYQEFLVDHAFRSPIPYVKVNGVNFATTGYLIWDACREIIMMTRVTGVQNLIPAQRGKLEALLVILDDVADRSSCLQPSEYQDVVAAGETLGQALRRLAAAAFYYDEAGCHQRVCDVPDPLTHQFKQAVIVLNNPETNYCLLTTNLSYFVCPV